MTNDHSPKDGIIPESDLPHRIQDSQAEDLQFEGSPLDFDSVDISKPPSVWGEFVQKVVGPGLILTGGAMLGGAMMNGCEGINPQQIEWMQKEIIRLRAEAADDKQKEDFLMEQNIRLRHDLGMRLTSELENELRNLRKGIGQVNLKIPDQLHGVRTAEALIGDSRILLRIDATLELDPPLEPAADIVVNALDREKGKIVFNDNTKAALDALIDGLLERTNKGKAKYGMPEAQFDNLPTLNKLTPMERYNDLLRDVIAVTRIRLAEQKQGMNPNVLRR